MDLNGCFYHFIGGYLNIEENIPNTLNKLSSILKNGYILSRENQKSILKASFHNKGSNWNKDEYISICTLDYKSNIDLDDNHNDEIAYETFCKEGSVCIILNNELLYNVRRRKNYFHMIGEIQVKDKISYEHFVGIGVQLHDYLSSKSETKNDLKLLKAIKKVLSDTGSNLPVIALNNGDDAFKYLMDKEKVMILK